MVGRKGESRQNVVEVRSRIIDPSLGSLEPAAPSADRCTLAEARPAKHTVSSRHYFTYVRECCSDKKDKNASPALISAENSVLWLYTSYIPADTMSSYASDI